MWTWSVWKGRRVFVHGEKQIPPARSVNPVSVIIFRFPLSCSVISVCDISGIYPWKRTHWTAACSLRLPAAGTWFFCPGTKLCLLHAAIFRPPVCPVCPQKTKCFSETLRFCAADPRCWTRSPTWLPHLLPQLPWQTHAWTVTSENQHDLHKWKAAGINGSKGYSTM